MKRSRSRVSFAEGHRTPYLRAYPLALGVPPEGLREQRVLIHVALQHPVASGNESHDVNAAQSSFACWIFGNSKFHSFNVLN